MKPPLFNLILGSLIFFFLNCSCSKKNKESILVKDDELSIQRENYTGNSLRLDGYYFESKDQNIQGIYFLFNNGVILHGGDGKNVNTIDLFEREVKDGSFYNSVKNEKGRWGAFIVDGKKIKFERWYSGEGPLKSYIRFGEIINDTAFKITHSTRSDGSEFSEKDELYIFKKLLPKPDSTNNFVK